MFSFVLSPSISLAKDISITEFVEFLIAIGAISPQKAAQARAVVSQYSASEVQSSTSVSTGSFASASFSFSGILSQGSTGQDILVLQRILNADPDTQVSVSGAGSPGNETQTFGPATKSALLKFQKKYNLTQTGIVDEKTKTTLNNILIAQRIGALPADARPSIIVKANGQVGNVSVQPASMITLAWDTKNVYDCASPSGSRPISGTQIVSNAQTGIYAITCQSSYGPISGYVNINTGTANSSSAPSWGSSGTSWGSSSGWGGTSNSSSNSSNSGTSWDTPTMVNASCGSAGGSTTSYKPTAGLCSAGTAGEVTSVGISWQWNCAGSNGGGSMNCYARQSNSLASSAYSSLSQTATTSISTRYLDASSTLPGYIFVQSSPTLKIDNTLTIEAWIKPTAWNGNQIIVIKGQDGKNWDYGLSVKNGVLQFANSRAKVSTMTSVLDLNKWSHIAVVVDENSSNGVTFYVNGQKIGQSTIVGDCGNAESYSGTENIYQMSSNTSYISQLFGDGSYSSSYLNSLTAQASSASQDTYINGQFKKATWLEMSDYPLYIGGYMKDGILKNKFTGLIDDVRVWNTARTAEDIKANAVSLATTTTNIGLKARWNFEAGNGNDTSANTNNGTLNGSIAVSSVQTIVVPDVSRISSTGSYYDSAPMSQCMDKTSKPPEAGGSPIAFGGQVIGIAKCTNKGGEGENLYKVVITACQPGDMIGQSKAGAPVFGTGYITFRENNPPLPSVGDSILGGEVPDEGGKCKVDDSAPKEGDASNDNWIGDASGPLGTGSACTNTDTNGGGEANQESSKTGSGSGSFEGFGKLAGELSMFFGPQHMPLMAYGIFTKTLDHTLGINLPSPGQIGESVGSAVDSFLSW